MTFSNAKAFLGGKGLAASSLRRKRIESKESCYTQSPIFRLVSIFFSLKPFPMLQKSLAPSPGKRMPVELVRLIIEGFAVIQAMLWTVIQTVCFIQCVSYVTIVNKRLRFDHR